MTRAQRDVDDEKSKALTPLLPRQYRRLARRNNGMGKPEYKLFSFLYSVWLPPLGLLLYGLVTYYGVHWIFADAGIVLFCLGVSMAIVAIQSYIVDCYALLAGSALTSTIVFRSLVGTGATIVRIWRAGKGGGARQTRGAILPTLMPLPSHFLPPTHLQAAEDLLLRAGMLWSNVGLALACVVLGVPIALIVYYYGARLRRQSRHATHKR